ncbi:MAG: peroxiredoxin family protein, partial [Phycisphaerae bacterium]
MAELRGIGAINAELQKLGVRLAGIAVDPPEKARGVVESQKLPFPILADTTRATLVAYDLVHKGAYPGGEDGAVP